MREWRNRMQISFEEERQVFHLYNDKISYVIQVEKQRYLKHCYYGKRIKRWHSGINDYYYDHDSLEPRFTRLHKRYFLSLLQIHRHAIPSLNNDAEVRIHGFAPTPSRDAAPAGELRP